jgi:hypothetical protein
MPNHVAYRLVLTGNPEDIQKFITDASKANWRRAKPGTDSMLSWVSTANGSYLDFRTLESVSISRLQRTATKHPGINFTLYSFDFENVIISVIDGEGNERILTLEFLEAIISVFDYVDMSKPGRWEYVDLSDEKLVVGLLTNFTGFDNELAVFANLLVRNYMYVRDDYDGLVSFIEKANDYKRKFESSLFRDIDSSFLGSMKRVFEF